MKQFFPIAVIIVSLMVVTLEGCAQKTPLILTKEGVGCLKFGMKFDKIPPTCEGFYDRIERKIEGVEGGDAEFLYFYLDNELVAVTNHYWGETGIIYDHTDDILTNIIVYSSKISTPEGVYPGMPIEKLLMIKGGDEGTYCPEGMDGDLFIRLGEGDSSYDIVIDNETDLTDLGEKIIYEEGLKNDCKIKLRNSYFKPNAKVTSFSRGIPIE